ncbi:MAG: hypothetical protein Q9191_005016 [Dirinaria sp. TL-2023a]
MNQTIQTRLDRIDASLSTLIDSIASYNPSIPAAQELLAADDELNQGVQQLVTHQRNHSRITSLRSEIATLNATITAKLTSLATLRSEILTQKITPVPDDDDDAPQQVPCGELLDFAQRISRYTAPRTTYPAATAARQSLETKAGEEVAEAPGKGEVNGVGAEADPAKEAEVQAQAPVLPGESGFVPWPSEEVIRQGALGQIQAMLEQGVDPTTIQIEGEQKVEGGIEDDRKEEQRKDDAVSHEYSTRHPQQGSTMVREAPREEEKPKVFGGLDLYDPDEE